MIGKVSQRACGKPWSRISGACNCCLLVWQLKRLLPLKPDNVTPAPGRGYTLTKKS